MNKILIIKLGALGDVVRTTPLLRILNGEITWITQKSALPLLHNNPYVSNVIAIEKSHSVLKRKYDLVVNLDEDTKAAELAAQVSKKQLIGIYQNSQGIAYTLSSAEWFDMSLISRFGKKMADQKKLENKKSYQAILFSMFGKKFNGEEYILPTKAILKSHENNISEMENKTVGLEIRAGDRWMAKRWPNYPQLISQLKKNNVPYKQFIQYPTLIEFIKQINQTDVIVTTDSLALHLALGLGKSVIALFTCTSPSEIYGYDRTVKIISPLLNKYYYSTQRTLKPGKAISAAKVFRALKEIL